jgi:adenosylcobinamide-phosphate guanylyltransferase
MRGVPGEKPLAQVLDKPMIEWVLDAAIGAQGTEAVCVSVSGNTPRTERYLEDRGIRTILTAGRGYSEDLNQAMEALTADKVLVCPADLPLLTPSRIEEVVVASAGSRAGSFCVTVPVTLVEALGMALTYSLEVGGRRVVLCGVSVVDRAQMLTGRELEQDYLISEGEEFILNVNTLTDLRRAEGALRHRIGLE